MKMDDSWCPEMSRNFLGKNSEAKSSRKPCLKTLFPTPLLRTEGGKYGKRGNLASSKYVNKRSMFIDEFFF